MKMATRRGRTPFGLWLAVRLLAIVVAGLALVVLFRDVVAPILKGDVESRQKENAPRE